MLTRSLPLLLLLSVACTDTTPVPEGDPVLGAADPGWWGVVGPRIANDSRRIHDEAGVYTAHVGELTARFEPNAVRLRAGGTAGPVVALRGWDVGGGWQEAGAQAPRLGGCAPGPELDPAGRCLARLEYRRGGLTEWWASTAAGYEQGFEVASAAGGVVELELATGSEVRGEGGRLRLHPPEGLVIRVDVAGAAFPVTIDPLYVPAETAFEEADGAALHGYALSTGDVNGDGYVDAVVGAPSSDVTATDGGALYSYLGSASGLGASGTRYAPAYGASANLGAAVSIDGDVTGDGYDDLVWGAPGYSSDEGAVGLVLGSSSGLSGRAVSACTFASTGAWGTAVKIVPDWDGDGGDEVVTGAPDYDSATGLVYGFRGTSTGWTTQGIDSGSAAGDEFGASFVVGDFEGDGEEDLVIGAPGGGYASVLSHVYYTAAASNSGARSPGPRTAGSGRASRRPTSTPVAASPATNVDEATPAP